uniref:alpha-2-macroglobulin receptor-associated protein-like n=1 Tax=Styela clava TaxID=7725 RepID=UPI0019397527|nr:alpha-2-macroglobulin receptor-associated protein-like [Styela clava]
MHRSICIIFCAQFILSIAAGGSRDGNEIPNTDDNIRKFRSGRVNQVWEKAEKMKLPALKMTDLYADLKHHDRLLMEHKRNKVNQGEDDGLKEAELTDALHEIMLKYGLAGKKRIKPQQKREKMSTDTRFLEDPKLDKLWQTANKHGKFTDDELKSLHMEFIHHRKKVEEYELLKSETSQTDDMSDNAVEKQVKIEENNLKREKMTEILGDIKEGYERLHLKTKQGTLDGESVPFTEPRVANLWEEAMNGNFTEQELDSIKEELHHFQTRIQKHLFFRDQLKNSVQKVEYHGGKEAAPTEHIEVHDHLQNKVQDLAAKVKKMHHDISKKLSSGSVSHREL